MPLFWKNTQLTFTGIDLTILLQNDSVIMWKPQLTFPDASEVTMLGEVRESFRAPSLTLI